MHQLLKWHASDPEFALHFLPRSLGQPSNHDLGEITRQLSQCTDHFPLRRPDLPALRGYQGCADIEAPGGLDEFDDAG
jgi:hypothetical protein